jgi:hypothetical protein
MSAPTHGAAKQAAAKPRGRAPGHPRARRNRVTELRSPFVTSGRQPQVVLVSIYRISVIRVEEGLLGEYALDCRAQRIQELHSEGLIAHKRSSAPQCADCSGSAASANRRDRRRRRQESLAERPATSLLRRWRRLRSVQGRKARALWSAPRTTARRRKLNAERGRLKLSDGGFEPVVLELL